MKYHYQYIIYVRYQRRYYLLDNLQLIEFHCGTNSTRTDRSIESDKTNGIESVCIRTAFKNMIKSKQQKKYNYSYTSTVQILSRIDPRTKKKKKHDQFRQIREENRLREQGGSLATKCQLDSEKPVICIGQFNVEKSPGIFLALEIRQENCNLYAYIQIYVIPIFNLR